VIRNPAITCVCRGVAWARMKLFPLGTQAHTKQHKNSKLPLLCLKIAPGDYVCSQSTRAVFQEELQYNRQRTYEPKQARKVVCGLLCPASENLVFMQMVMMRDAMKKSLESVCSKSILKIACS
jgi:hypothetical protein